MRQFLIDSFAGQLLHKVSGRRWFRHNDELPGYSIPEKYLQFSEKQDSEEIAATPTLQEPEQELNEEKKYEKENKDDEESTKTATNFNSGDTDYIIVTWDGDDDPENPYNWPLYLKCIMAFQIAFLTVSVYMASAIYTPGVTDIMEQFDINQTLATLPLTMFVIGYGIGPIVFSPLSEHTKIGRTPIYVITLFIFCMMQIPTALSTGIAGMSVLRLIAGFFASPALSTGGASYGDFITRPYFVCGLAAWSLGAVCGPAIGPLIGSVLVVRGGHNGYESWRWTFWFMALISSCFLIFLFTLPETYTPYLLRKKAQRLRKLTGNNRIRSEAELKTGESKSISAVLSELLWRPIEITLKEPVVLLIDIYIALVYSIIYLFFESIPIVYQETKHFPLILMGVTYTSIVIGIILAAAIFIPYVYQIYSKKLLNNIDVPPETFLPASIVGAALMPVGLFIFGWTASPDIHWFPPLIGIALFSAGAFLIFQTLFNYMASSFKVEYLASVFSSNAFFRSVSAGCFPLFGRALFKNLGTQKFPVGWGSSLLAFLSLGMLLIPVFFYLNGPKLRARSAYAS
ncbi:Multidrug transporter flr1 [Lodderomyces elongisporus]|uniref:Multidrug transporter flr1 n=1 Tax=Lodderomyces elongisporus TaxID=36914 RepID=UPI0029222A87|nr:Multidrug transporter flr1 [Lodderomyces elongisporus]WLF78734.1 Multidrug transporter flr1 [Lodderomyces elongisporus]